MAQFHRDRVGFFRLDKLLHFGTMCCVCVSVCVLPQSKVASYLTNAQLNATAQLGQNRPMKLLFRLNYGSCFRPFSRLAALVVSVYLCVCVCVCVCLSVFICHSQLHSLLHTLLPQGNNSFCCSSSSSSSSSLLDAIV